VTLALQIGQFLDQHPDDSFSAFSIAARIGASRKSVSTVLARLANECKLRKRERGFYCSIKKSPGIDPGLLMPFELPGTDPYQRINPNPEERGFHEKKRSSIHGSGDPDRRCNLHRSLDINPNPGSPQTGKSSRKTVRKTTSGVKF
jgi:hypothetical protein